MQLRIFALLASAAPACWKRKNVGSASAPAPAAPTVRKLRRVSPSQSRTFSLPIFSMGSLRYATRRAAKLALRARCRGLFGCDYVSDDVGNLDELALRVLPLRVLGVVHVLEHLQRDFVLARRGFGVLVGVIGTGRRVGDHLAVTLHDPAQLQTPVVGDFAACDRAAAQAQFGFGGCVELLFHNEAPKPRWG